MKGARWRLGKTCKAETSACAEWLLRAARAAKLFITLTDSQQTCLTVCCLCFTLRSLGLSLRAVYFFFHLFFVSSSKHLLCEAGSKKKEKKRICSYQGKSSQGSPTSQSYHVWLMSRSQEPQPPAPHRCSLGVGTGSLTEQKGDLFVAACLQRRNGTLCFSSITYIDTHGREMNREMRWKFWESRWSCGI